MKNAFYVIDDSGDILKIGTEEDCKSYIANPINRQMARVRNTDYQIISADEWKLLSPELMKHTGR